MSPQLHFWFIQVVTHLLGFAMVYGYIPCPVNQNMNLVANEFFAFDSELHFCAKKGWYSGYIHILLDELWCTMGYL